jgi:histone acetyltransferase (RNA polymerase elongator complex component)
MTKAIIPLFIPHKGCQQACVFCNQRHITGEQTKSVIEIEQELKAQLPLTASQPELAYYGGTFTGLPMADMIALLDLAKGYVDRQLISGIRLSTHPATLTADRISVLKRYPIALVELGVQSFSDVVLRASKRGCTEKQIMDAICLLKTAGIPFGIQLMMGLPEDSLEHFQASVQKSIRLEPEIIRLYPTVVIEDTELAMAYNAGTYTPLGLEESIGWSLVAMKAYHQAGIPVIRLGLHASEELVTGTRILAGPFHPAFRQLVDAELIYQALVAFHSKAPGVIPLSLSVHPSCVSDVSGQKGHNRERLEALFGVRFKIKSNLGCPREQIDIETVMGDYSINKWN